MLKVSPEVSSYLRVLAIEDSSLDFQILKRLLPAQEFQVEHAGTFQAATERLGEHFDVYLIDYFIAQDRGTKFLELLSERDLPGARILVTSHDCDDLDSEARRLGADDFLVKGQFDSKALRRSIRYAIEHRRNERRLKTSRDHFRSIFEGTMDAMVISDAEGVVQRINLAAEFFLGPQLQVNGKFDEFLGLENWEKLRAGSSQPENLLVKLHDSYLEVSCTQILSSDLLLVVLRDVTQRHAALSALRVSEERLRNFLSHTPTVAFIKDSKGRYVFANSRYGELLGLSPEEIQGKTDHELWPPSVADKFAENDREVLRKGDAQEYLERTKEGQEISEWLTVKFPLESGGDEPLLAGLAFDFTGQRRLEAQLNQVQRMEALGRLAGGMAHDFNNLLSVILGNLELLKSSELLAQGSRELLDDAQGAGRRAAKLTKKLLSLSRHQVVEKRIFQLSAVVEELRDLLRSLVPEKVDFVLDLEAEVGPVLGDPYQIEQCLINLVMNAVDAVDVDGRIQLVCQTKYYPPDLALERGISPGENDYLSVQDDGTGISPDIKERVFEPFFTTKGLDATGLGLTAVYGTLSKVGGKVWFDSKPGEGTTFEVVLPLSRKADTTRASGEASSSQSDIQVILVDDEDPLRRLSERLLRAQNFQVRSFSNGQEALEHLSQPDCQVHLLLTDVVMPVMKGTELVSRARELHPELKVVFMSGYTEDSLRLDERSIFLAKPFSLACLRQTVERALGTQD